VLSPAEGPQAAAMPPASLQLSTRPSAPLPDLAATGTSLLPHSSKACSQGGSSGGRGPRQGGQEGGGSTGGLGDATGVLEGQPLAELDTNQLLKQLEQQLAVGKIHEPQARCVGQSGLAGTQVVCPTSCLQLAIRCALRDTDAGGCNHTCCWGHVHVGVHTMGDQHRGSAATPPESGRGS
jgi:hypothetical protein